MSKVIAITGAGLGLGRALARRFAADGDTVVLLGRTLSKVEAVATELGANAMAVQCDVCSPDSVKAAFATIAARHSKIDVLINNAAIYGPCKIADASDEHIVGTISTNLIGAMLCARSAIPMMSAAGHIINVSSESVDMPFSYLIAYQASKAGLESFSLNLQREVEPLGIRVTIVRAGQMYEEGRTFDIDPELAMAFIQANIASGVPIPNRPSTRYDSTASVVRAVIDLPADVLVQSISVQGWASGERQGSALQRLAPAEA